MAARQMALCRKARVNKPNTTKSALSQLASSYCSLSNYFLFMGVDHIWILSIFYRDIYVTFDILCLFFIVVYPAFCLYLFYYM